MWLRQMKNFKHRMLGAMRRHLANAASLDALRSVRERKPEVTAASGANDPQGALSATRTLRIEIFPRDCRPPRDLDAANPDNRALGLGLHRFCVQAVNQRQHDQSWLDTSKGGRGLQSLGTGWCAPEPWGVWGRGSRHCLDLVLHDASSDILFLLDAHVALVGSRKQVTVDLVVGEQLAFVWTFSTFDNRNIRSIRIPAAAIW